MSRAWLAVIVAVVSALTLAPAAHAGRTVGVTLGQTAADATFAEGSTTNDDTTILVHLEKLIDNAARGSSILVALHSITDEGRIERALRRAHDERSVNIFVAYDKVDGTLDDWPNDTRLDVKKCTYGCLSSTNSSNNEHDSIMHMKFFLFSSTSRYAGGAQQQAAWVGSANMTASTGTQAFNNAITWYGDGDLVNQLWVVFIDMWNGPYGGSFDYLTWPNDNPQTNGNGVFNAARSATWGLVSPERQTDLWASQLAFIRGPEAGGSAVCRVGVMHNYMLDTRVAVAEQLRRAANEGCVVRIVVNMDVDGDVALGPQSRDRLCNDTRGDLQIVATRKMHSKAVLSYGTFNGTPNQSIVWTGSHNLTGDALLVNDELLMRIDGSRPLFDAFASELVTAWDARADHLCTAPMD